VDFAILNAEAAKSECSQERTQISTAWSLELWNEKSTILVPQFQTPDGKPWLKFKLWIFKATSDFQTT
jgi:hypothetical protein